MKYILLLSLVASCASPSSMAGNEADAGSDGPPRFVDAEVDSASEAYDDEVDAVCSACAADEICIQINDSSAWCRSPAPTVACRRVSAACRDELPLIVPKSTCYRVSSQCQAELCPSPSQCRTTPPCGNESSKVQAWCYGP